ncbi:hypothetical protein [Asticcacaulis excentricus]|uniref:Uncharacterized protein n=1 Tax=Asticcacaulis excentricus TaxID=78587 RepID=A0A3G9G2I0_9CAUL|nr:hypothetical protein [Asticcacaulis excentricus]BBF81532.1 conserved hypothetical protein [Asticcacaulis excentricus]
MSAVATYQQTKGAFQARSDKGKPASRDVRNLANLGDTASTSRVLNLAAIALVMSGEKDYTAKPFFRDRQLNRAILIKHTLRTNERDLFSRTRRTATKIVMPFDAEDLRLGGRSVMVNQVGFEAFCRTQFGIGDVNSHMDVQVLRLLDDLPSLDPFLVREHLSRNGFKPGACYLNISAYDIQRMIGFANAEIEQLVRTAFGNVMVGGASIKLAGKILSNELDQELSPLRQTLHMSEEEFSEGIFSWRGFLYFKWRHEELQSEMRRVIQGLGAYQPSGAVEEQVRDYLREVRPRLARRIAKAVNEVARTLSIYDRAYFALTQGQNPGPFRQFLLQGPKLFFELGETIGILGHISSFWTYRMMSGVAAQRLTALEYADVLMDFDDSLMILGPDDED